MFNQPDEHIGMPKFSRGPWDKVEDDDRIRVFRVSTGVLIRPVKWVEKNV